MSNTRKTVQPLNFAPSNPNNYYSHIYTTNTALSFFRNPKSTPAKNASLDAMITDRFGSLVYNCVELASFGINEYPDHDSYHQSLNEVKLPHKHIIKLDKEHLFYKHILPSEFECLLKKIKESQLEMSNIVGENNDWMLTKKDMKVLNASYHAYYKELKKSGATQTPTHFPKPEKKSSLPKNFSEYRMTLLHSVNASCINTLIDYYLIPAMHQTGYSMAAQKTLKISLLNLYTLITLGSFAGLPLSICFELSNLLLDRYSAPSHNKLILRNITYNLLYAIYTYANISEDLLNYASNVACAATGSAFGSAIGYGIIHTLPKLRKEPIVENQPDTTTIERPVPAGLRHRSPH